MWCLSFCNGGRWPEQPNIVTNDREHGWMTKIVIQGKDVKKYTIQTLRFLQTPAPPSPGWLWMLDYRGQNSCWDLNSLPEETTHEWNACISKPWVKNIIVISHGETWHSSLSASLLLNIAAALRALMLMPKLARGHVLTGWEMHWADLMALSAFLTITPIENNLEGKSHSWF